MQYIFAILNAVKLLPPTNIVMAHFLHFIFSCIFKNIKYQKYIFLYDFVHL